MYAFPHLIPDHYKVACQCGGFLADEWLNQPEPDLYSGALTPSQRKVRIYPPRRVAVHNLTTTCKYLDMILKAWGNWTLFQELLVVLRGIGDRHGGLSISNIATRWVLDHPFVGAVIIGRIICLPSKRRLISVFPRRPFGTFRAH
jgi:hypothetical protein